MKLLITTQVVDERDPFLGFFVGWLHALSPHFETIHVICLKEGTHTLPGNVSVHSLGKERGASRTLYVMRFFRYLWVMRQEYDAVFVHMNQEYVFLGAIFWKLMRKHVYLWRNHQAGNFLTTLAVRFSTKTFCTSRFSFIARFSKNVLMPVGVDTSSFRILPDMKRVPGTVLFLGRMAPSKRPDVLLEALATLPLETDWRADFFGSALPKDRAYEEGIHTRARALNLESRVTFSPGIPHSECSRVYNSHEIFVNLAASGMYDKTIFEAAACGCIVLAASRDFAVRVNEQLVLSEDGGNLPERLAAAISFSEVQSASYRRELIAFAEANSLESLARRLAAEMV